MTSLNSGNLDPFFSSFDELPMLVSSSLLPTSVSFPTASSSSIILCYRSWIFVLIKSSTYSFNSSSFSSSKSKKSLKDILWSLSEKYVTYFSSWKGLLSCLLLYSRPWSYLAHVPAPTTAHAPTHAHTPAHAHALADSVVLQHLLLLIYLINVLSG